MPRHLAGDLLEQYAIGALDLASTRFVEAHVAECAACAALLQREAALEVGLYEAAQHRAVVSLSARRRRRLVAGLASAAAVLAAGVALVFSLEREPSPAQQPRLRHCVDSSTASECISRGQFDGVITIGPDREPIIPRYDVTFGGQP